MFVFPVCFCLLSVSKFENMKEGALLQTYILQVATGLLVAEVNVNTMCELGSGGVSLVISSSFFFFVDCLKSVEINLLFF